MAVLQNDYLKAETGTKGATITALYYKGMLIGDKGSIKGRFANRIAGGSFTIGGEEYHVVVNEFGNTLHGGTTGFDKKEWTEECTDEAAGKTSAVYTLVSEDGDQGFPGTMNVKVRYTLDNENLIIDYEAVSDKDTVINLTNHIYFNLNGIGDDAKAYDHRLIIDSDKVLELNGELIPTGRYTDVDGSKYDFRNEKQISTDYDNCFVMKTVKTDDPSKQAKEGLKPLAVLTGTISGLKVNVYTNCPGMQVYNTASQVCLETQEFPDAMHHDNFPSVVLKAGEVYKTTTVYRFTK